jgi:hypothetical protein
VPAPALASSAHLTVSPEGPADFRTISEALRAAAPGARIVVRPGVYREGLVLDRPVEIIAEGQVVIESADSDCVVMGADEATLRGLTLRCTAGASGGKFYAVDVPRGRLLLEGCDVSSDSLACVAVHGASADPTLRDCLIHGGAQGGVMAWDGARGTVECCEIFGHAFAGVEIKGGADLLVRRCRVHTGAQSGVYVHAGGRGTLEDCDVYANALAGVETCRGGDPLVRRCMVRDGMQAGLLVQGGGRGTFEDCLITRNARHGVRVHEGGQALVEGCELAGNSGGPWDVAPGCRVRRRDNRD